MVLALTALNHKLTSFQSSSHSSAELNPILKQNPHIHSGVLRLVSFNNSAVTGFPYWWQNKLCNKHIPSGAWKHVQCFTFWLHNYKTALQCGWLNKWTSTLAYSFHDCRQLCNVLLCCICLCVAMGGHISACAFEPFKEELYFLGWVCFIICIQYTQYMLHSGLI